MSSSKPKRPGAKQHDSFFRKMRKRHDERHHAGEVGHHHGSDEQQPLLREEHPDSASEAEPHPLSQPPTATERVQNVVDNLKEKTLKIFQSTATMLGNGYNKVTTAVGSTASQTNSMITSNPKRLLGAICAALLLLCIGEAVDIIKYHNHPPSWNGTSLCNTPVCIRAASRILENLHPEYENMNPCDNFEQYVCRGFQLNHKLRQDQTSIFTGTLVEDEMYMTLRHILEQDETEIKEADRQIFAKVKDHYTACTNEDKIKEYGAKPLQSLVDDIRSYFASDKTPLRTSSTYQIVAGSSTVATNTLGLAVKYMMKQGIDTFVAFHLGVDDQDPSARTIVASPSLPLGLPVTKYYQDKDILGEYTKSIEQSLAHFYDLPKNTSAVQGRFGVRMDLKDLTRGIVQFETRLAAIIPPDADLKNAAMHNKLSIDEFDDAIPQLSLKSIVHDLAPAAHNDTSVTVLSPAYIQSLSKLILATRGDILQSFLVWKAVQSFAEFIESDSVDSWKRLMNSITGQNANTKQDRWRKCVTDVNADLGWILSKFYIERAFSDASKSAADSIITDVRNSFAGIITAADWMTSEDTEKTVLKLEHMHSEAGYSITNPDVRDSEDLAKYYSRAMIQNSTYLENKIQSMRADVVREWSKLAQTPSIYEWRITATTVQAYYDVIGNAVVLPAAVIQEPLLYRSEVPASLRFGALGAMIGHEIIHAFDNIGSQYNEKNQFAKWWSNETSTAFEEKETCFTEQYSKFTFSGPDGELQINGSLTLQEAIADAGGVHAAYEAWAVTEADLESPSLPGLEKFDQKQLFWLSYGNWWCSKATVKGLEQKVLVDPYLPESVRVQGALANSQAFREAFDCPDKEPACKLW